MLPHFHRGDVTRRQARPAAVDDFRFRVLVAAAAAAEGGNMAAAQLDRDTQSSLCAEFVNFSAKDTAAVSGSPAAGSPAAA